MVALLDQQGRDGARTPQRFVDAATVARLLGVDRDWVYAHQKALGAIRLPGGSGQRGRLRFDVERLAFDLRQGSRAPRTAAPTAHADADRYRSATTRLIDYDDGP